jgi:hypothetical protein
MKPTKKPSPPQLLSGTLKHVPIAEIIIPPNRMRSLHPIDEPPTGRGRGVSRPENAAQTRRSDGPRKPGDLTAKRR